MDGDFHPEVEQQLAATWERRVRRLSRREQLGDGAFALLFVAAAAGLPALHPPDTGLDAAVIGAYTLAFAAGTLVRFCCGSAT